jgi:O-antigen/teichoic acid export membrane protein
MADHTTYLKKVALSSLFNSATSALATAVLLPLLIKTIGLASYGLWAILAIFIGIASALDFGIWKSLVFLIPRGQYSRNQLLWSSIVLCSIGGILFTIVFGTLLLAGFPLFGKLIANQGNLVWWLGAGGCTIVFASLLTNLARGMLEASYRGHWVNVGYGLLTVFQYGVAAIMAQWTHDPRALIVGSGIVYVLNMLAHFACLIPDSTRWECPNRMAVVSILRYGGASFLADAPGILLGPVILYLFLLVANNAGQYGTFDIALRIATLAATTLSMLSAPFFTIVSSASVAGRGKVRAMIARHLHATLALAAVGWLIFWAIGKPLLAVFFPERSGEIYRASLVMLIGTAAVAALEPVTRMLMGIGRLKILSMIRLAMLGSALLSVAALAHFAPLDRFSISCAVGFGVSAIGLMILNKTERWGYSESACPGPELPLYPSGD